MTAGDADETVDAASSRTPTTVGSESTPRSVAAVRPSPEQPGHVIGPYTLVRLLGEGGFGAVWLADRHEPWVQQVALKLIRAGMDSASVLVRFEQERQALALMDHPHIAKVLDGGVTLGALPWFAMEFVRGEPITAYCDRHHLGLHQRLELFLQVCDAVQHAHMRGIIHRDLKPANIMVCDVEGSEPIAKVIDFGIAKALTVRLSEQGAHTGIGQMIGTPEYMSPEQAEPDATDIDTRADVFALGVVLYELLVGTTPFDGVALRAQGFRSIQRTLREVDPPSPSARLTTLARQDPAVRERVERAMRRRVEELARQLRSELEWIPLKAMRKDRDERYTSASDLALDVRNYLGGRPLLAMPESRAYRVRKWARRNTAVVAGAAAVAAALLIGLVVSLWGWSEAVQQRNEATRRERDAARVLEFMTGYFAGANPMDGGSADTTLSDAMAEATRRLDAGELSEYPESEASLRLEIARVLRGQGEWEHAAEQARRAAATFEVLEGPASASVGAAISEEGLAMLDAGQLKTALGLFERALSIAERASDAHDPALVGDLTNLALAQRASGSLDEAQQLLQRALGIASGPTGDRELTAVCMANLGDLLGAMGRLDDAEDLLRRSMAMREDLLGRSHPDVAESAANLGLVLQERARFDDAAKLLERAHAIYAEVLGDRHPHTTTVVESLVLLYTQWHATEPNAGHDAQAQAWRARLSR